MSDKKIDLFWPVVIFIVLVCLLASRVRAQEPWITNPHTPEGRSIPANRNEFQQPQVITNLRPYDSVAEISVPGKGQGSGTLIATREDLGLGLVLLCRHVGLKPNQELELNWIWARAGRTKGRTLAVIQGPDFSTDMAVAVTELPRGVKPLPVESFDAAAGPWTAAGYRDGALRVAGPVDKVNYNGKTIATNNVFVGGMSGGPMFNRYGEIVGVVVASDGKSYSLCSDGPMLRALVQRFLVSKTAADVNLP